MVNFYSILFIFIFIIFIIIILFILNTNRINNLTSGLLLHYDVFYFIILYLNFLLIYHFLYI